MLSVVVPPFCQSHFIRCGKYGWLSPPSPASLPCPAQAYICVLFATSGSQSPSLLNFLIHLASNIKRDVDPFPRGQVPTNLFLCRNRDVLAFPGSVYIVQNDVDKRGGAGSELWYVAIPSREYPLRQRLIPQTVDQIDPMQISR
jgi:hypothetical protein